MEGIAGKDPQQKALHPNSRPTHTWGPGSGGNTRSNKPNNHQPQMTYTTKPAEYATTDDLDCGSYGLQYDAEGLLLSYWTRNADGSHSKHHTPRGLAASEAILRDAEDITPNPQDAAGLLRHDYALDNYNTWKA